ncbi:hypothetical protein N7539_009141 [Penicillium diatomitis]|uniref:Vacuolar ATPase assembly protein VMA22 n=1 Tax=Penicillium diatomitis TaxID=2819901 RepID=A0A9X0BJN7_9EURO|nr:uncharacterized protein N7539_009141 [Penicillium diatomitis]KAJ5469523.1 hypothetical protein N7539_009141 [Penicillium diatomitis]
MSEIPTPPPSRPGSQAPEAVSKIDEAPAELRQSLDLLLENYLLLLDRQQALQSGLSKTLASGFLSLAHANYTCPPGRRYGADYYDERMKATRKISIHRKPVHPDADASRTEAKLTGNSIVKNTDYTFQIEEAKGQEVEGSADNSDAPEEVSSKTTEAQTNADKSSTTESPSVSQGSSGEDSPADGPTESAANPIRKKVRSDNPLHWYGILVPSSLRSAQRSFMEVIETRVPDLAGTIVQMRDLEVKIYETRAKLGIDTGRVTTKEQ